MHRPAWQRPLICTPKQLLDLATLNVIRDDMKRNARNVLVASTKDNPAFNYEGGLFTNFLIQGLKGDADLIKDGVVNFDELQVYCKRHFFPTWRAQP
jgi:hypothetical protein